MQDLKDNRTAKLATRQSSADNSNLKANESKLPVFISPERLTFCSSDASTHRRTLTIYNPYDFVIKFRILCTKPRNYHVQDSKGTICEKRFSDISIRRTEFLEGSLGSVDKFRVHIYHPEAAGTSTKQQESWKLLGIKEVPALVTDTSIPPLPPLLSAPAAALKDGASEKREENSPEIKAANFSRPVEVSSGTDFLRERFCFVLSGIACLAALSLPLVGEPSTAGSYIPEHFALTIYQKMVICYFLGLLTMAIFK